MLPNGQDSKSQNRVLFVTHVDRLGPYLKVCGHLNHAALDLVHAKINQLLHKCTAIDPTWPLARHQAMVQVGMVCIYKRVNSADPGDFEFVRVRVLSVVITTLMQVEIELIDYGNITTVGSYELLLLDKTEDITAIPSLCSQCIVLGVCNDWTHTSIEEVKRIILQQNMEICIKMELQQYKLITMKWKDFNFTEYLMQQKKIGSPVANDLLLDSLNKLLSQAQKQTKNLIETKRLNNKPYENFNNLNGGRGNIIEPVPVMPPIFSGPNNHRQNTVNKPLIQYANNFPAQHMQAQYAVQQQYNMNRPRLPQNMGNLRAMYPVRAPVIYASTPGIALTSAFAVQPNAYAFNQVYPAVKNNNYQNSTENKPAFNKSPKRTCPATFKSNSLTVGSTYDVYVSFVENGPCLFSIQLASAEQELTDMMNRIERVPLKPLTEKPALGSACIARYSEDGQLYRALIVGVQPNLCKVAYIDYGNAELVQFRHLYEIPDEFLTQKPFAIRFTLSGYKDLQPLDESLKKAFKDLVIYHHCQLSVMPLEGPPLVQYCKLFMKDENVLEVLKKIQKSRLVYAKAEDLKSNDIVEIRYIDSPKHFYVQKVSNIGKFETLMDEMFLYYNKNQVVPTQLTLGSPCIVKYDNEWYRAEVMRADDTAIIVRHVDFGYEQKVTKHLLSNIAEQHLQLPRQAVQCCLKGFENADINKENATKLFEMLAEESNRQRRSFTVKVFRIQPDGVNLVNLFTKDLNVMKKLYKLSMPFEQYLSLEKEDFNMSGNHVEHKEHNMQKDVSQKTPSLASSDAISSIHSSKKQTNLNKKSQQNSEKPGLNGHAKQTTPSKRNGRQNKTANLLNTSTDSRSSDKGSESSRQTNSSQAKSGRAKNAPQGYSQAGQKAKSEQNNVTTKNVTVKKQVEQIKIVEEYVPLEHVFPTETIKTPKLEDVIICWWISPHQFYTHLKHRSADFERLMSEMQNFYLKKPLQPLQLRVGANVIAKHRQDNLVYRARIVGCNHMLRKYKVYFVDYGNQYTVTSEDIWQVEKRFAQFPCMAYLCAFQNVISNFDHLHIIDCMDKYLPPGAVLTCEYLTHEPLIKSNHTGGLYYVNVKVNGSSLRESLIKNGFLTNVNNELRLDLFAGQQIRAKICEIKDLLNFKIQIDDHKLKLLSAFDDVRFVKSNPHLSKKFQKYYDEKTCVINIKEVNDNKVLLLRPMVPLFKEENRPYICAPAVCFEKFNVYILHVASISRLYGQPVEYVNRQEMLVEKMYEFYENNGEILQNIDLHRICAALSADKNWYRARIESIENEADLVTVFYIDYGNTEQVSTQNLKQLDTQFYKNEWANTCVVEINLPIRPHDNNKSKLTVEQILQSFNELVLEQELYVKPLEMRKNHVIADILTKDKKENVVDLLLQKQLIKCRDLEYARKQLEKDKKNVYEYIETVDLTIEDDTEQSDLANKKQKNKKKTPTKIISEELNKSLTEKESAAESEASFSTTAISTSTSHVEAKSDTSISMESETSPIVAEEETKVETVPKTVEKTKLETDLYAHMEKAILSHCDNPAQFFIHTMSKVEELRKLQENLQIVASSLPPLMGLHNGAHCISQYSVDKQWYRARVIDAELMLLKYIDFGNTDCVSDVSELREMSVFPDIAPLCIPCGLPIKPNCTIDWVDAANTIFNEAYGKVLHYEYITRGDDDNKSYINLYIEGVNIADKLIADGYAKRLEIVQSDENCYISHVNGICDFYIQYEKDSKALELIEIYLADNVKNSNSIEKFEKGMVVAALFPDDEMWYRAKLLQIKPDNTYEVLFIDYGNTSTSPEVRKIATEIAKLPALSKKCCLELPAKCADWSDAAEEKFSELAAQGETIFTIVLREPKVDCSAVHLLIDGHNINNDLIPLCPPIPDDSAQEYGNNLNNSFCNTTFHSSFGDAPTGTTYEGEICHVKSAQDLYVNFHKDSERLQDLSTSLEKLRQEQKYEQAIKDDLVAALVDNKKIMRARVLNALDGETKKWNVFLLDTGKEVLVEELRELPLGLQQVKPFAKHCKLETTPENELMVNSMPFLQALKQLKFSLLNIELVSGATDPALVRLYDGTTNESIINQILQDLAEEKDNKFCMISHALSHEHFYIQRKSNLSKLEFVTKTLQKQAADLTALKAAKVDDVCVAYSSEDDLHYRVKVLKIHSEDNLEVYLLDYGNIILSSQLFAMPEELQKISYLAQKCTLVGNFDSKIDKQVLETQFNSLVDLYFGEFFEIISEVADGDVTQLKLHINYEDLFDCLNKAVENVLQTGSNIEESQPLRAILHDCTIIHVNSPHDFYIQMCEKMPDLEKITDKLLDAEKELQVVTKVLEKGALCAALFPEDEIYYRARIVQQVGDEGQYEVHYIDFGNNAITDKILELTEEMQTVDAIAKNCTLHGLREPLSMAACEQFQSLVDARFSETFQVEFLKTDVQPIICNLFYQQHSVATEITELLNQSIEEILDEDKKAQDDDTLTDENNID